MIPKRRRIKKAKYNDVSFYIDEDETCGGRRIVTHEFPFSDTPATEDLGRKARQWNIQGFVGGALYKEATKKLQNALEKPGIGILDHPYVGKNKEVRCQSYRINQNSREWGQIWFSMTFSEAGELPVLGVKSTADQDDKNKSFLEKTLSALQDLASQATGKLSGVADSMDQFSEAVEDSLSPFVALRESLGDVMTSLASLKDTTREVAAEPGKILNAFASFLDDLLRSPLDALSFMKVIGLSISPFFDSMTSSSNDFPMEESASNRALTEAVTVTALIQMSRVAARSEIHNTADREKVKSLLLSVCDRFLDQTRVTPFFEIVQSVRSENYFTLQKQDEERGIQPLKLKADTNLILLAYELYGDVSKESDLWLLNPDLIPAFILKDTHLEVS